MNIRSLVTSSDRSPARQGNLFGTLQREIDRLFDDLTRGVAPSAGSGPMGLMPSLDVAENDKEIEITAELPGLDRADVDISIDDGMLTIRGEKKVETENKDNNYHVAERSYGAFRRVVMLPPGIDASAIKATMDKGVLRITIPKPARAEPKKIEVKAA